MHIICYVWIAILPLHMDDAITVEVDIRPHKPIKLIVRCVGSLLCYVLSLVPRPLKLLMLHAKKGEPGREGTGVTFLPGTNLIEHGHYLRFQAYLPPFYHYSEA